MKVAQQFFFQRAVVGINELINIRNPSDIHRVTRRLLLLNTMFRPPSYVTSLGRDRTEVTLVTRTARSQWRGVRFKPRSSRATVCLCVCSLLLPLSHLETPTLLPLTFVNGSYGSPRAVLTLRVSVRAHLCTRVPIRLATWVGMGWREGYKDK